MSGRMNDVPVKVRFDSPEPEQITRLLTYPTTR